MSARCYNREEGWYCGRRMRLYRDCRTQTTFWLCPEHDAVESDYWYWTGI